MKTATLERLAPLLNLLRAHPALREVRPAAFHLNGRDFLLAPGAVFWWGFDLPHPPVIPVARTILIFLGWSSLT